MEKHVPVYYRSARYANEHGEIELYRASRNANMHCRAAIEQAISRHFDGYHLSGQALDDVLDQFSVERVLFILSATLDVKNYDGRFSRSNRLWASELQGRNWFPYHSTHPGSDCRDAYIVNTHSAVLDGFVDLARKAGGNPA